MKRIASICYFIGLVTMFFVTLISACSILHAIAVWDVWVLVIFCLWAAFIGALSVHR